MELTKEQQSLLKRLPGVDRLLESAENLPEFDGVPRLVMVRCSRAAVEDHRRIILSGGPLSETDPESSVMASLSRHVAAAMHPNLFPLINATGVVVHTNLGRSVLADEALAGMALVAGGYSNLEYDLTLGKRGSRYEAVADLLCEITGAQAAMVVNNNAGAVLLCLDTIAAGKKVIVSRGELVEIGGSFRVPDVMAKSGAILKEVGTTNRTHPADYENAIDQNTGLLLKVHQSNFAVVGFTARVSNPELAAIGRKYDIPVMEDLGSGTFIDFSAYGMKKEPTVQESVAAGIDIVTFSGDKLLGGPQAGIIVGKESFVSLIRKNPITRALRIDKMTLAALESTLRLYRDPEKAVAAIPTLRMLTVSPFEIREKAERLAETLSGLTGERLEVSLREDVSRAGGGSLPLEDLPTTCVCIRIRGFHAGRIERRLRAHRPPVIGRIESDLFLMDLRTVTDPQIPLIGDAVRTLLEEEERP